MRLSPKLLAELHSLDMFLVGGWALGSFWAKDTQGEID